MTDDKWKIDMLRRMWSGQDRDHGKDRDQRSSGAKKGKSSAAWPSVDLHHFKDISVQMAEAEKAIDRAILDGHGGIIIIHGKGEGILRSQLKKELLRHQHVAELKEDEDAFGNSGKMHVRFI
jgi:dsDNA-specific endonuclease/ATPase MutS2